jgi:hypothetical protein
MFPVRSRRSRFPLLSLEEEGRLYDMPLRETLVERCFKVLSAAKGPTSAGRKC